MLELTDDLDLTVGDAQSRVSAFWTMLVLSAVIATALALVLAGTLGFHRPRIYG